MPDAVRCPGVPNPCRAAVGGAGARDTPGPTMPSVHCSSILVAAPVALALAACSAPRDRTSLLDAVVWTQTSAEREALCEQVFAAATAAMRARTQGSGDAGAGGKPWAVIADIDETMLDNSPYQAALVRDGAAFSPSSWADWCRRAQATALPGAVAFADACRERSVTVFYVTNRDAAVEADTRRNLAACGLPLQAGKGVDVVLCRGEVDGASGKQGRRDRVASGHDVVLWLGDDLGDFLEPAASVAQRQLQVREHRAEWGSRWFVLPNPMYGSWERALVGDDPDADAAKRRALAPML